MNLVKDSSKEVDDVSVMVLGKEDEIDTPSKMSDKEKKRVLTDKRDLATLEALDIQFDARDIIKRNIRRFDAILEQAEPKEFSSLMKTLSDISGVTKKEGEGTVVVPIQINLDI